MIIIIIIMIVIIIIIIIIIPICKIQQKTTNNDSTETKMWAEKKGKKKRRPNQSCLKWLLSWMCFLDGNVENNRPFISISFSFCFYNFSFWNQNWPEARIILQDN